MTDDAVEGATPPRGPRAVETIDGQALYVPGGITREELVAALDELIADGARLREATVHREVLFLFQSP